MTAVLVSKCMLMYLMTNILEQICQEKKKKIFKQNSETIYNNTLKTLKKMASVASDGLSGL